MVAILVQRTDNFRLIGTRWDTLGRVVLVACLLDGTSVLTAMSMLQMWTTLASMTIVIMWGV